MKIKNKVKGKSYGHWIIQDKFANVYDTETVEIVEIEN